MWRSAISGEYYRAIRNVRTLCIAYGTIPLLFLIFGSALDLAGWFNNGHLPATDQLRLVTRALSAAGNPIAYLFFAIGATSLAADDYRWETWRLVATRNARVPLIVSKFILFSFFAASGLILSVISDRFIALLSMIVNWSHVSVQGDDILYFLIAFFGSWLELCTLGLISFCASIATRSTLGGIIPAFLFAMSTELALAYLQPPPSSTLALIFPAQAGDVFRLWASQASAAHPVEGNMVIAAGGSLLIWIASLLMLSVFIFVRQDLSKE